MRTRTETVHEGEWFTDGTVDEWLAEHAKSAAWANGGGHRDLTPEQAEMIRKLATTPPQDRFWVVRVGDYWHRLWTVGLYDGWVFWRKRICLGTDGPISGMHHHEGYNLDAVALGMDDPEGRWRNWKIVEAGVHRAGEGE